MKIKITKCTNPEWWYNDKVGEEFTTISDGDPHPSKYKVQISVRCIGFVDFDDCIITKETPKDIKALCPECGDPNSRKNPNGGYFCLECNTEWYFINRKK